MSPSQTIKQFRTLTGSVYQVDTRNRQVRRVSAFHSPGKRMNNDGSWQFYHWCTPDEPERGEHMFFDWDGEGHGTVTSIIVTVEDIEMPDDFVVGEA